MLPYAKLQGALTKLVSLADGDYIVGMDGDFNCRIWKSGRALLNQRVCKITPNENVLSHAFMAYLLPGYLKLINDNTSAVTVKHLSSKTLGEIPLPLPPLHEQRRIVQKLDALSARSAAARNELAAIKKLVERYKTGVLDQIFNSIKSRTTSLADVTTFVTSGSRGWAKYYAKDGALFVRVGDTRRGSPELCLSDVQYVRPPKESEGKRTLLQKGDVVVSITADLGRVGIVPEGLGEAYVSQHVALVRPIEPEAARFIAWYLISPLGQAQLLENDRGATKAGIGLNDIRDVKIPILTSDQQQSIVRRIEAVFAKIDCLAAEAEKALKMVDQLDQRILAKAFAGELVPQDPNDEPASVMLERIRAERTATPKLKRQVRKKKAA